MFFQGEFWQWKEYIDSINYVLWKKTLIVTTALFTLKGLKHVLFKGTAY